MSSNSSGKLFAPNERGYRTLLGLPQRSRHRCILVVRRPSAPTFCSDGRCRADWLGQGATDRPSAC